MDAAGSVRLLEGRYRLSLVIGRGGMGTVWRARDELLGRDVAVKEIVWPPYLSDAEREAARHRAVREARMAARVRHPNVVGVYDIIETDGRPWIVMELLPYRSLRDVVRGDGPLTPVQAAQVGLGILAALRAAHAEGIVHRDVKPANILICPDGRAVLTDFGIARAADSPTVTSSGVLIGSPSYMAPERARGGQAGAAGDLWGLGASLYTAVEGHPPFDREGALQSLTAVVTDEPDPAVHAGALRPVISGLLRKDPDKRLGGAETERMLRRVAAGGGAGRAAAGPSEPGERTGPWESAASPARRPWAALGASVAVACVTAVAAALALVTGDVQRHPTALAAAVPHHSVQPPSTASPHPSVRRVPAKTSKAPFSPVKAPFSPVKAPSSQARALFSPVETSVSVASSRSDPAGLPRPHPAWRHNHVPRGRDRGHGHEHGQNPPGRHRGHAPPRAAAGVAATASNPSR
jgi:serine/threonine protein kinase